jgi:hypothetical protein
MKKIICFLFLIVSLREAKAQLWLGGQLGYSTGNTELYDEGRNRKIFLFSPRIGYQIGNWVYGADLGFGTIKAQSGSGPKKYNTYNVGVFGRHIRKTSEHFGLWFELNAGATNDKKVNVDDKIFNMYTTFRPGVLFYLNEHLVAEMSVGSIGLQYGTTTWPSNIKYSTVEVFAGLAQTFSLGVNWKF